MISDESTSFRLVANAAVEERALHFSLPAEAGFLSIIIPVYQDVPGLTDTLESLVQAEAKTAEFEVIVVNDGGSAEIESLCHQYHVRCVSLRPNRGSYAARNAGIAEARGELIGLLDADVVVDEGWLGAVFAALAKNDMVAGRTRMKIAAQPTLTELYQAVSFFPAPDLSQDYKFITTVNVAMHRRVFEKMGGFDARLRSGGDYEFSQRAADARFSLGYSEAMLVTHPCRNYPQLLQSIRRTLYGQANLHTLYGSKFQASTMKLPSLAKLLIPRRNLFQNAVPAVSASPLLRARLFLFAWMIKLRMIPMVISVRKQLQEG